MPNRPMISNNNIEPTLLDDTNIDADDLRKVVINEFLKEHGMGGASGYG